jgi:hypothetical protein
LLLFSKTDDGNTAPTSTKKKRQPRERGISFRDRAEAGTSGVQLTDPSSLNKDLLLQWGQDVEETAKKQSAEHQKNMTPYCSVYNEPFV